MFLHGTSHINQRGHLEIGGCDTVELAQKFGTPLYVMDEQLIRERMRSFRQAFTQSGLAFQTGYASKAFNTLAMCRIADEEGYMLDVVSEGELFTALEAGFPAERIYFHGNNKTPDELIAAIEANIRLFVVDNFYELSLLCALTHEKKQHVSVMLRVAPGVEAHTHAYIQTGQEDSKFGFDLASGQAHQATELVVQSPYLKYEGFHCHIGSQIFEASAFRIAIEKMAVLTREIKEAYQAETKIINLGGGFGIRYGEEDQPQTTEKYVQTIAQGMKEFFADFAKLPEVWIEPGRFIVGEAGTTLYTTGAKKEIPGVRTYISIDGGITDNPRPALYQAKYESMLANRAQEQETELVSIAGKCCESGDMLLWDVKLPQVNAGDVLAISCTGAYNYSMASNYNRLRRPAVIFVRNGEAEVVVEREKLHDLISNDRIPRRLQAKVNC